MKKIEKKKQDNEDIKVLFMSITINIIITLMLFIPLLSK